METRKTASQGILIPLYTFGSIGIICIALFCIVRRLFTDIYSPRRIIKRGRPPNISNGFFSWIPVVYSTPESFLVNTVGLDGVMFLRFLQLGYKLFGVLSLLGLILIAPVNYFSKVPDFRGVTGYELEALLLQALSINNVCDF